MNAIKTTGGCLVRLFLILLCSVADDTQLFTLLFVIIPGLFKDLHCANNGIEFKKFKLYFRDFLVVSIDTLFSIVGNCPRFVS